MYYRSGTVAQTAIYPMTSRARRISGQPADATDAYATASGGRTSWPPSWKYDIVSKILPCQSMRIYLKNNPAKFRPYPIWNDRALIRLFNKIAQQEKEAEEEEEQQQQQNE